MRKKKVSSGWCTVCECSHGAKLIQHMRVHQVTCTYCGEPFPNENSLAGRQRRCTKHRNDLGLRLQGGVHRCDSCARKPSRTKGPLIRTSHDTERRSPTHKVCKLPTIPRGAGQMSRKRQECPCPQVARTPSGHQSCGQPVITWVIRGGPPARRVGSGREHRGFEISNLRAPHGALEFVIDQRAVGR